MPMARSALEFSYRERRAFRRRIYLVTGFVLLLLVLTALLFRHLLFPVAVRSSSMYPCAEPGSLLLVSPLASVSRGDAVVVAPRVARRLNLFQRAADTFVAFFTFQQLRPFHRRDVFSESSALRRVVGIPGDTVYMKDYVLYIRPEGSEHFLTEFELSAKSYDISIDGVPERWDDALGVVGSMPERRLHDGEYFLLCDNRTRGVDSRIWGAVPAGRIAGRALFQYFPFSRFGLM